MRGHRANCSARRPRAWMQFSPEVRSRKEAPSPRRPLSAASFKKIEEMILQLAERAASETVAGSISELLGNVAARTASATAIASPGRQPLSYRRLVRQVEDTVRLLSSVGLGPNDRVSLVAPNGPEM